MRAYHHASHAVCPRRTRSAHELQTAELTPRELLAGKDARTLAREILGMSQEDFGRAFKRSPMERAKLRGLERHAAVVSGDVGTAADVDALARTLDDPEPLVRDDAAWALARPPRQAAPDARATAAMSARSSTGRR